MKIIDKLSGSKKYTVVSLVVIVLLIITSTALAVSLVSKGENPSETANVSDNTDGLSPQAVQYNDNTIVSSDLYNELQTDGKDKANDSTAQTSVKLVEINNFLVGQMKNNTVTAVENAYSSGADKTTLNDYKSQVKIQLETLKGYDEFIKNDKMVPEDLKTSWNEVYALANTLYESIGTDQLSSYSEFVAAVNKFTNLVVTHVAN